MTRGAAVPRVVPWREMLGYAPFRELLIFNLIYATVLGSLGVFTVEFLRDFSHFDVASVLYLSAFSFVGALVALPFCGSVVDATGSKPLMRVADSNVRNRNRCMDSDRRQRGALLRLLSSQPSIFWREPRPPISIWPMSGSRWPRCPRWGEIISSPCLP